MISTKKIISFAILLSFAISCQTKSTQKISNLYQKEKAGILIDTNFPFNMPEVLLPSFKTDTFNIIDFGAIPNSHGFCTKAINNAIETCASRGGGVVIIPSGLWITGSIHLKSNVNLHTESGTYVLFTDDLEQYSLIHSYFEGNSVIRCESPIMGINLENIAITGDGIFDGNGSSWRPVKIGKMTTSQWQNLICSGGVVSKNGGIWYPSEGAYIGNEEKDKLPQTPTVENMKPYKHALRPVMVSLVNSKKILLEGVTFQNSPAWNVHPLMCEHITLHNLTIRNPWYSQNGDGLDLESCRIGIVRNCRFDVGDDAICIKSGKDKEGRERGKPTELFVISDCVVYHAHGGFVVGSEMSGGVRYLLVKNLTFIGTDCGLRFKSTRGRGGVVENIWLEDIRMCNIPTDAIRFNLYYAGKSGVKNSLTGETIVNKIPVSEETPVFKNIHFKNIHIDGAKQAIKIMGIPEMPVQNLQFKDIVIRSDAGIRINYAAGITFEHIKLSLEEPGIATKLSNSQHIKFNRFDVSGESQTFQISGATTRDVALNMENKKLSYNTDISIFDAVKDQVKIVK